MNRDLSKLEKLLHSLVSPISNLPNLEFENEKFYSLYQKIKSKSKNSNLRLRDKLNLLDFLLFWLLYINENNILENGKTKYNERIMELITKYFDYHSTISKNYNIDLDSLSEGVNRLIVLLTHSCQLRCTYCSVGKYNAEMSEDILKEAIKLLFTSKKKEVELQFFGGEPLLKFDLLKKAVSYAKELSNKTSKKVKFLLTTNGIALTDEIMDYLIENNFTIEFSMDGDKETQLKYRRDNSGDNYFNILLQNLAKLKEKKANFSVISVIMPENIEKLSSNVKFFIKQGIKGLQVNYALGNYWNKENKNELFNQLNRIQTLISNYPEINLINNLKNRREPVVLNSEITVDCDGTIFLESGICLENDFNRLKQDFKIGDINKTKNINTIFTSRFKNFYRLVNVYSNRKEEFRKIILNNIRLGLELKKYNNFSSINYQNHEKTITSTNKDLTITLKCNNNCIFCPRDILSDIQIGNSATIEETLKKVRNESDSITLSGGEVTTLDNFFNILDNCNKLNFRKVCLITNARKFANLEFVKKTLDKGINSFGVSIYSTNPQTHDSITQVPGSFDEALKGLHNLLHLNANLWVNITVSKYNQSTIYKTIKDLYEIGVENFQLISVVTNNSEHQYNDNKIKEQISFLKNLELKDTTITIKGFNDYINSHASNINPYKFKTEPHEFKTFFAPDNANAKKYLSKTENINQNNSPKDSSLYSEINYLAYMTYQLLNDDLYPPISLGDKLSEEELIHSWQDTIKKIKEGEAPKEIGIYVHIPFCITKCKFCYCFSFIPENKNDLDHYLDIIEKQSEFFKNTFKDVQITSLYIGGGTPSILTPKQLSRLFHIIYSRFNFRKDAEIIFEATPDSIYLNNFKPLINTRIRQEKDFEKLTESSKDKQKKFIFAQNVLLKYNYQIFEEGCYLKAGAKPIVNTQESSLRKRNASLLGLGYFSMSHSYGNYWYQYTNTTMAGNLENMRDVKPQNFYYKGINCNKDEEMRKFMINNLKETPISIGDFIKKFSRDPLKSFKKEFDFLRKLKKFKIKNNSIFIDIKNIKEAEILNKIFFSPELKERFDLAFKKEYDENTNYITLLNKFFQRMKNKNT